MKSRLGMRQLLEMLDRPGEGVWIADSSPRILCANRGMAAISRVDVESLIGGHFLEHWRKVGSEWFQRHFVEAGEPCPLREFGCGLVCPVGRTVRLFGWLNPIVVKGQFPGMVGAFSYDAGKTTSNVRAYSGSGRFPVEHASNLNRAQLSTAK